MAAGFSVKDALNKNSKAGIDESPRARFRTKDISIFKMYRNDMNFYSIEQIEELAGDILMYGLKQNLELVYAPCDKGEYRIVAGERRWEALKYLVSKGYKEFEIATSKLTTPQDDDEEQVEIIIANAYRVKTISDMIEEETRLKASLERMKAAGKKVKGYDLQSGRLREVISSMLHMSKTKVAQIEAVNNNLIPEWKEELKGERLTFSAAYELSGMSSDEQREALGKFIETGELTHKDIKDMKEAKAAEAEKAQVEGKMDFDEVQQVSESDTEAEIGMNPPEVRTGDNYETPHPEGITSICYSCTEYETCNVKTGTCTSCDQYKNRTEAYKTDEQRYSEEQDAIDHETKKKLREMEQEEKMQKLPSTAPEKIKTIRVSQDKFEEYTGEYRKPYMITKDDGFKVGNVVKLVVFAAGKATGETADMRITCKDDDITCSGLSDGWCVIGLKGGNE
ncbi:ParB/RepB/Spo0J family partition protein [Oliverpabstia intestinalis]|uniref:ParB/RepB/Spo0J family partition protein n=1 Tax=Oliverpabstia intestinalis TaxID=2606633 RepID=UPI003F8BF9AD